jgi:hypothetical protein
VSNNCNRRIRHSRQHPLPATRHIMVSGRKLRFRPGPLYLRYPTGLGQVL